MKVVYTKIQSALCLCFVFHFSVVLGQSLKVSSLNAKNDTEAILQAMRSDFDTLFIDKKSEAWEVSPLRFYNIDNKVIILGHNMEVRAKVGAFPKRSDALFSFINCKGITVIGNGSILRMNKSEYLDGEWRHGINLTGSKDVSISDLTITNTGGDGIYITGSKTNRYSENIKIDGVKSIANKRQGISIISAVQLTITNSVFAQTKGTLPGAGLDIEPNTSKDVIQDIVVKDCLFENNYGNGIAIGLRNLESTSPEVSILFENNILRNNHAVENTKVAAAVIIGANADNPVQGKVVFRKLFVEDSNWGLLYTRKRSSAFKVLFEDCALKNTNKRGSYPLVYFEVPNYYTPKGAVGGITIKNLFIDNPVATDLLLVRGSKLGTLSGFEEVSISAFYKTGLTENPIKYINYAKENNRNVTLEYSKVDAWRP